MTPEEKRAEAQERLAVLKNARALEQLVSTPGWTLVFAFQEAALDKARMALRQVDTGQPVQAIDALQRWQIAENLLEAQVGFINRSIEQAAELRGTLTIDDAMIMEKQNEYDKPAGDSGGRSHRPDPAGY